MKKNYLLSFKMLFSGMLLFCGLSATSQIELKLLDTGFGNALQDINDSGQAVKSGGVYDFTTNTTTPIDAEALSLNGINNNGDLIGMIPFGTEMSQPGYKKNGVWHPIGYFFGSNENATSSFGQISENGTYIAGQMSPDGLDFQAYLYNTETNELERIADPANEYSAGYAVNNDGKIGGWYDPQPEGTLRVPAYMTTGSVMYKVPPGQVEAEGQVGAISNSNLIVGDRNGMPFLYDLPNNVYTEFEIPNGYDTATFTSVSENGVAVGYAQIWTPDGPIRDAIIYHPSLGTQPVFIQEILDAHGIEVGTFDGLLGTAISISPDGNYVCGWDNSWFFVAVGWVVHFDDLLLSSCYIQCPQDITMVSLDGPQVVNYTLPINCAETPDATVVFVSGLESGSVFPYGTTEVVHNLVDTNGTVLNTCSFTVTINEFYCIPVLENIEPITRVNVAGINNTSAADATEAYEDFTEITGNVNRGQSYPAIFEGYTGGEWTDLFTAYTDWNQNGQFEETEKTAMGDIFFSSGTDGIQANGTLVVPADAVLGNTTMRVIKTYGDPAISACNPGSGYGQVEDYTLIVSENLASTSFVKDSFKYFPNPVTDLLTVSNPTAIDSITVYNMLGQEVVSKNPASASAQINLAALPSGSYLVKAISGTAVKTFKIVKR